MFDLGHFFEQIKTPMIVIGIIVLVAILIFLYLLIAGADESRRHVSNRPDNASDNMEKRID